MVVFWRIRNIWWHQDKLRQAEQERDYALSHQKKVEIPVEKPVLYQKCQNCNQTAYLKAKERYDTQREKMAGRYKAKTAMYEALMFLLIWYSASTTLFRWYGQRYLFLIVEDSLIQSQLLYRPLLAGLYWQERMWHRLVMEYPIFLLFVQLVYVGIRWYVKGCRENRGCV